MGIACVSHLHHIERGGEEGGGPQPEEGPRVAGVAGVGHGQGARWRRGRTACAGGSRGSWRGRGGRG